MYEIAIMTRAAPAKILGLNDRGSLKPGKIADISIYDPKKNIDDMFSYAKYVFKDGVNVIKDGKIINIQKGRTKAIKLNFDKKIQKDIQKWFDNYYSVKIENFVVDDIFFDEDNFSYFNS